MSCGNPDCTGCDGASIDDTISEIVRNRRHFAIVPIVERPYYVFTVGMEELYNQPELLILADDGDPMIAADHIRKVANLVADGQATVTTEGPLLGTSYSIRPATEGLDDIRQLMGSATRFYNFGEYRVSLVYVDEE